LYKKENTKKILTNKVQSLPGLRWTVAMICCINQLWISVQILFFYK